MDESVQTAVSNNAVITTHCENVADFFNALSPRADRYHSLFPRGWIFRGHSNADHELIPTALRAKSEGLRALTLHAIGDNKNQVWAEKHVLDEFLKVSDGIGLLVPEDTQKLRGLLDIQTALPSVWPPDDVLSLMALAQHHGLPTRLLDWSGHPLKAALFAAMGAAEAKEKSGRLSVWALCIEKLDMIDFRLRPFTVLTAPSASNPNLRAQEGIFTLAKRIRPDESQIDRTPFDALLTRWMRESKVASPGPWFHHITLPQMLAAQLCFDLALDGITRAALFPDFYGVVNEIRDRAQWYGDKDAPGHQRVQNNLGLGFSISVQENVEVDIISKGVSGTEPASNRAFQEHLVFYSDAGFSTLSATHATTTQRRPATLRTVTEFFKAPKDPL